MISRTGCLAVTVIICLLSCAPRRPSAASRPPKDFSFAPALRAGSSWSNRVAVEQSVAQKVGGRNVETKQYFSTTYRFAVLGRDAAGELSMEAIYEGLAIKMTSPMGNYFFDSAGPTDPSPPLAALRGLVGGRFTFRLGSDMRVRDIGGLGELAARMAAKSKDLTLASSAGSYMNEASIRRSLEAMFGLFPRKKIAVGESWTLTSSSGGGTPVVARSRITATKIADECLSARVEGLIEPAMEDGTAELRGTQSGNVELDTASLRILGGSLSQNLAGGLQVGEAKIPITVASSMLFELAE